MMKPNKNVESTQICSTTPQYGTDAKKLQFMLPDMNAEGWKEMSETKIMHQKVRHFRLLVVDGEDSNKIKDDGQFVYKRYDQQDYYCVREGVYCNPVRWEMSGYNTMIGSHFDYYVLDIHEFVRNPEFDNKIFEQPMQNCSNYSS